MNVIKDPIPPVAPSPEQYSAPADGVTVVTDPNDPEWQAGEAREAEVFIESRYVESADELRREYEKYRPTTEFVVAQKDGKAGGSVRVIHFNPETGFKTTNDIAEGRLDVDEEGQTLLGGLDLSHAFEIGTLSVEKELRGLPKDVGRLSVDLYAAIYGESLIHGTEYALASFHDEYFHNFKQIFGSGVQQLGPAKDYMGSPTIPALIDLPKLYGHLRGDMLARVDEVVSSMQHG